MTDWKYAFVETPEAKECSLGLQAGEVAQFKAQPDHLAHREKFGGPGWENRGPLGEKGNYSPTVVQDALPWSELVTPKGFGRNLDGTPDGSATPKSCKHEKFTDDKGRKVDHQLARVIGCIQGFRTGGLTGDFYRSEVPNFPYNRHLIEISGVDDEINDPSVIVTIYKGIDQLLRTAGGESFVPYTSQRIDTRFPQFTLNTRGKIVDGVLIIEPIANARFPIRETSNIGERRMRDVHIELKLTATGAEGTLTGYEDLAAWWNIKSKGVTPELDKYSPAGMYRALHRYADGYPDSSGKCTAISAAYSIKAIPVIVVHPPAKTQQLAKAAE